MSCEYNLFNDWFGEFDGKLRTIADKITDNKLKLTEIGDDLVEIEKQLIILNKLKFLESVDVTVMSEDEKMSSYQAIMSELFADVNSLDDLMKETE